MLCICQKLYRMFDKAEKPRHILLMQLSNKIDQHKLISHIFALKEYKIRSIQGKLC